MYLVSAYRALETLSIRLVVAFYSTYLGSLRAEHSSLTLSLNAGKGELAMNATLPLCPTILRHLLFASISIG